MDTTGPLLRSAIRRSRKELIELSAEAMNTRSGEYPTGVFDESSSPNTLLASSGSSALLPAWPTSDQFRLTYRFDPTPVAGGGAGDTTYHVSVLDRNGIPTPSNSCSDL